MSPPSLFHPAVAAWFESSFRQPTAAQAQAWPAIKARRNVLVSAPTGSGKTLAAFMSAIDDLVRQGLDGGLPDETQVVYVSPLKALSNDIRKNLDAPLSGIRAALREQGLADVDIRTWVRTGDTPAGERQRMVRRPPHIVVTTPESLYVLLGSESGRRMLATTRTVIVDEIHALAPNKRGSHLALSLERLAALCGDRLLRIGLSATQKPIEDVARFLVGAGQDDVAAPVIVDWGHRRARDLALDVPDSPLEAVMSAEVWDQVYRRLADLVGEHRTTLIFVNTRRMAERATRKLSGLLGDENVAAHHGSLAKEQRLDAEQRLKHGKLKALVATASLELGIDIGDVDLVCQLGSPRSIASFLQRVGRSGHAVDGTPKGRLFPLSRDELVECAALLDSVRRGELDRLVIPEQPLDVLAQQIVAEVAAREYGEDALYALVRRAWPYRNLAREDFAAVVDMLSEGFSTRRGRRGALIHYDGINRLLRGRRGARLTALTSGGTIPDNADYQVLLEPENHVVGTVNEDFAVESLAGDIFQLGNRSYRIQRVERGVVRVEDAHGAAPTIPFWLGEAPGRSDELSESVSRLRTDVSAHLRRDPSGQAALRWLIDDLAMLPAAAEQLVEYLAAGHAALGCLPTQDAIVLERFFDEAGGMQLVVHSPYGSRINRAWGLALRKRFCVTFNFELQAAATEDNIVISLTQAHSFALDEVARYLHSGTVRAVLTQALLDSPMFTTRWRWVIGVALALPRFRGGRKVPPQLARMGAEDLIGAVFPDQIACAENLPGEREIPDHPLVRQAIGDSLTEAMDLEGLERLLRGIESGAVRVIVRDLTQPSPLALEVLSARPYAYLDDAPLEERRTQAVMARRWMSPQDAADLGRLDPDAIARVRSEAWPEAENADELHDALVWLGFLTGDEVQPDPRWSGWLAELAGQNRAAQFEIAGSILWVSAERLPQFRALWPKLKTAPALAVPSRHGEQSWSPDQALVEIVRGRLEGLGPAGVDALAHPLGLRTGEVAVPLAALEAEGFAMRGRFTPEAAADEWCERRLLSRIHHYTLKRLRAEIEPVAARDFLRFLFAWQHVSAEARMAGPKALDHVVAQLEGFEAPAGAWESEILAARLADYEPDWLDERCLAGHIAWMRLRPRNSRSNGEGRPAPVRTTPITLLPRRHAGIWTSLSPRHAAVHASPRAQVLADRIKEQGASFFDELMDTSGLLRSQVEEALAELVALGVVTSDSFGGLRALLVPSSERRPGPNGRRRRRTASFGMEDAGRWALVRRPAAAERNGDAIEHVARTLLTRYGVVFWRLLEREAAWLPPWRELLRVYRRLESRGEIRGGRFVAGFSGEQFALPEAIGLLRATRRQATTDQWVSVSGADPLNLVGILTPGAKLPALAGNRLLYRDGIPTAVLAAGDIVFLETLDHAREWTAQKALLRGPLHAPPISPHAIGEVRREAAVETVSPGRAP
ncbi:MAG: ATP-dependent helicase Lhr and Lhr-like helicase [Alphaproteobacteria bacterium]|jgi:ATP-dependent Lhr-like helicase|nr:ATP-dependent helicase Lhr and Lhr-like helicase [Alphaproteobacteria bacterium]